MTLIPRVQLSVMGKTLSANETSFFYVELLMTLRNQRLGLCCPNLKLQFKNPSVVQADAKKMN